MFFRLYGINNCPCVAMTATATDREIKDVVIALGLREAPVILKASPILPHIKYSILKRPSNNHGLDGTESVSGKKVPGLMDLLRRVYLDQYLDDLGMGSKIYSCLHANNDESFRKVAIGIRDWGLVMGLGIKNWDWNWGLRFRIKIEYWDWALVFGIGFGNRIGDCNWD